ncbi:hypothetical protein [Persicitalea jodogahamensis]|uniref:Peptidase C-terminal archaeal/bacterial domain-containing protein n=1 Tax=Persicitalea jodogahamensis TaxID=402147 RepID=A0A8J3GD58_9BACT|nr:hypothetical protein [Persicitalea jodogahamensis]GHB88925.1 hypothetical protein GCM10007390_51310 [Persicitalea jodogahamensis]
MKKSISLALLLAMSLFFSQCSLVNDILPKEAKSSGQWNEALGKGGGDVISPRNHLYSFEVKSDDQTVTVKLSADTDVRFHVYDPLGQQIVFSNASREETREIILKKGVHSVWVNCRERDGLGSYKLSVTGTSGLTRIPYERMKLEKVKFSADGGGGNGYWTPSYTFKNHYYQFETTEDKSLVDISMDMSVNDGFFILYNQLGEAVGYSNSGRSEWLVRELPKGKHTILLGTTQRDALNSIYEINIFGKVQNLTQITFQSETIKGSWADSKSIDRYTLRVTEDNTSLDVSLKSPNIDGYLALKDPVGNAVAYSNSGRNEFILRGVNKGVYTIEAYPNQSNGKGNYSLIIYGQFADLKKL